MFVLHQAELQYELHFTSGLKCFVDEPLRIVRPLQDVTVIENQPSVLICELNRPEVNVTWTKAGQAVEHMDKVTITAAGVLHTLSIEKTTLQDEAEYCFKAAELTTKAEILVDG